MDKQRASRIWITAILIGLPILYVASFGPACWIVDRGWFPVEPAAVFYSPLFIWESEQTYDFFLEYSSWYSPELSEEKEDLHHEAWGFAFMNYHE